MAKNFSLSRVFRFVNTDGAAQVSDFPDNAPSGDTDLEIRMKHFTEIENFSFLGFVLAHELEHGAPASPVSTLISLEVPDPEFKQKLAEAQVEPLTDEQLGDTILDFGINWEHFVATFNTSLIPGSPLVITDTITQRKIDSLDIITEALVREVNVRSAAQAKSNKPQPSA
jgi:hypothetical protein